MSTVRVYKSTDPGAPAHPSNVRGSIAALLRACLVTGYGAGDEFKDPAGWEEPYLETNNYACFRALSGARQFFQIDDNNSDPDCATIRMYDSMSDAQNGIGLNGKQYLGKQYNTATATEWIVAATDRTCYLFLHGQYDLHPQGFGDYASYAPADTRNAFLAGQDYTAYLGRNLPLAEASKDIAIASSSSAMHLLIPGNNLNGSCVNGTTNARDVGNDAYPVSPAYLGWASRAFGVLPGIYYPMAYRPQTHSGQITIGSTTYLVVDIASEYYSSDTRYLGQIWVAINDWQESIA